MGKDSKGDSTAPIIPAASERMEVEFLDAPHPSVLSPEQLLTQCELRTQRRSGPGGQHRNKTSSGVFLHHKPTGAIGEATECRSQAQNRAEALERLRYRLAVAYRTPSVIDQSDVNLEKEVRIAFKGKSLRMNDSNPAKPAVLALMLNDLHASGGQPSAVAQWWSVSTSGIIKLVKSNRAAFLMLNQFRAHHGRRALK